MKEANEANEANAARAREASACERDTEETPTEQPDNRCLGAGPRPLRSDPRRAHGREAREHGPVAAGERRPG